MASSDFQKRRCIVVDLENRLVNTSTGHRILPSVFRTSHVDKRGIHRNTEDTVHNRTFIATYLQMSESYLCDVTE